MTTIISRNNQTQSGTTISSVNTATVEVGELLVDVHNGSIGFLDDTGSSYHELYALPTSALNGSFPYFFNNKLVGLNPGSLFIDGSSVRLGVDPDPTSSHVKRLQVNNGYIEMSASAEEVFITGKALENNTEETVFEIEYNTLRLYAGDSNDPTIEFIDSNNKSLQLKQGNGQSNHLIFYLPNSYGTAGQVLKTNGSGTLGWVDQSAGGGSGTVNSGAAGEFAYYPSTGTTVDGVSTSSMKLTGSTIEFSQGIAISKGTSWSTQIVSQASNGTDKALQINLGNSDGSTDQLYLDIEDKTTSTTKHPCVRISPTNCAAGVGVQSKPALKIGDQFSLWTDSKHSFLQNSDFSGHMKFLAGNAAQNGITQIMSIGDGEVAVVGNITATGTITGGSSRSYKEDIQEIDEAAAYNAVMALEPVSYVYKESKEQQHLGFIAEDVPELVAMNDRKSLAALDITAALTKVIQKQDKEINELKEDIEDLKNLILNSGVN